MTVVFRVAAGPRIGFGHLVRCRSLARALGVVPLVSIRGSRRTRELAVTRGWTTVMPGTKPDLVVVDDPVAESADAWVRRARRLGVAVASIHDLGLAYVESDLVIDGTLSPRGAAHGGAALSGPRFAILDPAIVAVRQEQRSPRPGRVLIALGGGAHVLSLAGRLSRAIAERSPDAVIGVVRGFAAGRPASLAHATWIDAPEGLAAELAMAQVAVVAGGVTLYEACALGVPVVAVPVTAAQHRTSRAAAGHGAAIDLGRPPVDDGMVSRAADAVAALLQNEPLRRRQSAAALKLVDGHGAFRVATGLTELVRRHAA